MDTEPNRPATDHPVLVVAGPTASGKSALAADVAAAFDGVVVNADSMQVYRELRVLTARPSAAEEARVPHRLFGILPAAEACSAGGWLGMARDEIAAAHADGRLPIVVGGTGLYLKALTEGLAAVPDIPDEVRAEARAEHARLGGEAFRAALAERDPESVASIPAGDSQRLIRAWEVVVGTGRPLPDWQRDGPLPPVEARVATIALVPPRDLLYAACDGRFDAMMADGALEEARALDALGLDDSLPAMKAVGVPQLLGHIRGEIPLADAVAAAKQATRNLAKRQLTWIRHQMTGAHVISAQYSERLLPEIFSFIRQFVLTPGP